MEMCPSLYRAARSGRSEEVVALLLQQRHGAGSAAGHRQVAGNLINLTVNRTQLITACSLFICQENIFSAVLINPLRSM
jgi:hypothetical protein